LNFTIKAKLLLGFIILLGLIIAASMLGVFNLQRMNDRLNDLVDNESEKVKLAARINQGVVSVSRAEKNIILAITQEEMDEYADFILETEEDMGKRRLKLRQLADDKGKVLLDEFALTWDSYMGVNTELRSIARLNSNVRARNISQSEAREAYDKAATTMALIVELNDKEVSLSLSLSSSSSSSSKDPDLINNILINTEKIKLAARINRNLVEIQRGEKNLILSRTQNEMDEYAVTIEDVQEDMEERMKSLEQLASGDGLDALKRFKREYGEYIVFHKQVRKLSRENANARAFDISSGEARRLNDKAFEQMAAIVEINENEMERAKQLSDSNYSKAQNVLIILSGSSVIFAIAIIWWIVPGILRALKELLRAVNAVAQGDTSQTVERVSGDEIGAVMKAANEMLESLRASIEQTNTMALGDYTADIVPRSEKDDLGKAMQTLSRTLRETSQVAEEVAGGNYKAIMEVKGDNDLLSISVNKMTRSLSLAISELEEQISERRKTQSQLIQAEKFSAIGQLGSGVAHELNSPLDGLLTMLRIRRDKASDDEHNKLSIMVDAAEHMAKIIRDFGSFSGKSSGKFSKIDTKDVIESTLSFSGIHLLKHDIKITRDYDNNHLDILGDKSQLQQVVLNIFTNARDAMPHGGEFVIRTRNSENSGKVIMEFIDTGVGIKEEDLPRIFDTFFTTKEQGKGIGLGLSISYGIIKSHNGEILVESPPNGQTGKGTKFTISLPALKTRKGNNNGKG